MTDQGAIGWGLTRPAKGTAPAVTGRPLLEIFDPRTGVTDEAAIAFDFALHDLAAMILGVPVHRLLGDGGSPNVPCYDGAIYMDDLDPPESPRGIDLVLDNCSHDYELGFRDFKLKIGRGNRWMNKVKGLQRDVEITRSVRAAFPDSRILVDANDGFDLKGLLEYLDAVGDCDLYWIEEPFAENRADLLRLRRHLGHRDRRPLIADGESYPIIPELLELGGDGLLDVLLMDVVTFGLTSWRAVMPRLAELGLQASPHSWGLPIKTYYAAHMAAGLGNIINVEGVPGTDVGLDTSRYHLADGLLTVPDLPGFGIPPPHQAARTRH